MALGIAPVQNRKVPMHYSIAIVLTIDQGSAQHKTVLSSLSYYTEIHISSTVCKTINLKLDILQLLNMQYKNSQSKRYNSRIIRSPVVAYMSPGFLHKNKMTNRYISVQSSRSRDGRPHENKAQSETQPFLSHILYISTDQCGLHFV